MPSGVYKRTEEHCRKISEANKGKSKPEGFGSKISEIKKGIKFSEEHKEKISKANKGHEVAEETKEKISKANKGRKLSKEHKNKIGKANAITKKGIKFSEEHRRKLSEASRGKRKSEEHKKKLRISAIKRIERDSGFCYPNFNIKATEFFKSYDLKHNTKGVYRNPEIDQKEFHIKELGYFPDYINFEKKIIIEYDESYHERQINKDLQRQKEIQEFYPDFEFLRIKEKTI